MKAAPRWLLILGLAFVFGYFGIDKFLHPLSWIQWIPSSFEGLLGLTRNSWLQIFGIIEIAIAAGLILPIFTLQRISAALAAAHIIGVLTQTGWNEVAVRDIGLLSIALALIFAVEQQ